MTKLKRILAATTTVIDKTSRGLQGAAAAMLVAMMVVVVVEVILRYIFGAPLGWPFEVVAYIVVAMAFLTVSHVQARGQHIRIEFLIIRLSQSQQDLLKVMTTILGLGIFILITWAGWEYAFKALQFGLKSEQEAFPLFPSRLVVPLGCFVMCLLLLSSLVRQANSLLGKRKINIGRK